MAKQKDLFGFDIEDVNKSEIGGVIPIQRKSIHLSIPQVVGQQAFMSAMTHKSI